MRQELISITIGGGAEERSPTYKTSVFKGYLEKAFPGADIRNVQPISTAASLNSACAYVDITPQDRESMSAFAKIHIESDSKSASVLGADNEYSQASLLAQHGWPVLVPLMSSESEDYPVLIYPRVEAATLFDLLEDSYDRGENLITSGDLAILSRFNRQVGRAMIDSSGTMDSREAASSPVQALFLERFKEGGRIDMWYKPDTRFTLPERAGDITWQELLRAKWVINGDSYDITLSQVIQNARRYLSFDGESSALACVSHGDDHSGNIFIDKKGKRAIIFDPAFAGWNPASLSNAKALAHNCILPMGGMYYDPKLDSVSYSWDENKNVISVDIPFESSVLYGVHEALAEQIIDLRILPLFQRSKQTGIDVKNEYERIKYALAGCALLTTNIPRLLEQSDGRGQSLLPLTIMLAELKGLPMLSYLREQITQRL